MKQQKIIGDFAKPVRQMDIEATTYSYVESIKALQELRRAVQGKNPERLKDAITKSETLIIGAGFSL